MSEQNKTHAVFHADLRGFSHAVEMVRSQFRRGDRMTKSEIKAAFARLYKSAMRCDNTVMGGYYQGRLDALCDIACRHGYFGLMMRLYDLCGKLSHKRHRCGKGNDQ